MSGSAVDAISARESVLLISLALACGGRAAADSAADDTTGAADGGAETAEPPSRPPPVTTGSSSDGAAETTGAAGSSGDEADDGTETGAGFLGNLDVPSGQGPFQCDAYEQDCDEGFKCVPWHSGGQAGWNGLRCVPVSPDPVPAGESCTVLEYPSSGLDDCELGSACWWVNPETFQGVCTSMCNGPEESPSCGDGMICPNTASWTPPVCQSLCDPIEPECQGGQGCYPHMLSFICVLDVSGDAGLPGTPCMSVSSCDPGSACLSGASITACPGAGCCVPFCDAEDPEAAAECAAFDAATVCEPWYLGAAPGGLDHVGVCTIPD